MFVRSTNVQSTISDLARHGSVATAFRTSHERVIGEKEREKRNGYIRVESLILREEES